MSACQRDCGRQPDDRNRGRCARWNDPPSFLSKTMSGIVGIINLDGAPVDEQLLRQMTSFMAYRGPDAQDIWIDNHVGLGHAMLRTTFESEREQQPYSLDGPVWITADARIDGRRELVQTLE